MSNQEMDAFYLEKLHLTYVHRTVLPDRPIIKVCIQNFSILKIILNSLTLSIHESQPPKYVTYIQKSQYHIEFYSLES